MSIEIDSCIILYISLSVLTILLLVVRRKNYWRNNQIVKLHLINDSFIVLLCLLLSFTSVQLHKSKKERHIPVEVGALSEEGLEHINIIDRSSVGNWDIVAKNRGKIIKNVSTYLIPLSLLLFIGGIKGRVFLFLIFTEGYVLVESITGLAKGLVDRFRPFAYLSTSSIQNLADKSKEDALEDIASYDVTNSFFSGDASITAYGLIFFAVSFSLFYPQSRFKHLIWLLAISGTLLECYFRVQSGKHFPTDVLMGALLGSLIAYKILTIHINKTSKVI